MKLCRFELLSEPGVVKSGIYHEQKVYETAGIQAAGIHDFQQVKFLAPIGHPKSIRAFESIGSTQQAKRIYFTYLNASKLLGPFCNYPELAKINEFDFEIRIAAILKEDGQIDSKDNSEDFILGYTIFLNIINYKLLEKEHQHGIPPFQAIDYIPICGPFITTPDELEEQKLSTKEGLNYKWPIQIKINDEVIFESTETQSINFSKMLEQASETRSLLAGEVICSSPLNKPKLNTLPKNQKPGLEDTISVRVDPLGTLTFSLSESDYVENS